MFIKHTQFTSARVSGILTAAEAAVRAIPPAFPLSATVAVNPFHGQTGEDLAATSARLHRVAGIRVTRDRSDYACQIADGSITDADLSAALQASTSPLKPRDLAALKTLALQDEAPAAPLPTIADLAADITGTDWPAVIEKAFGLWAAGHFDRGQALWSPGSGTRAYAAWLAWACRDLAPEIAGLTGFCAHAAAAPDTSERAILQAAEKLGLTEAAAETVFHRLLIDLGGWSQHARWLLWQAELSGETDSTLADLLAIRLIFEEALLTLDPRIAEKWRDVVKAHENPVEATADQIANTILQEASELACQRQLDEKLSALEPIAKRPALQAAFCIDVRSEVFRRALEAQSPDVETIGFAGFFGLPVAHRAHGSVEVESHLPVLLKPALTSTSQTEGPAETNVRIRARAARALDRFRQAAVSSFAFVEAAGPLYALKLVRDALGLAAAGRKAEPTPRLDPALSPEDKTATAAAVLRAMSLTKGFAPVVLLLGHGAQVTNNPHESAYHCGACGGHSGEVSARLLAGLLNDPETRKGLAGKGIHIPADTVFVAGLHDTTTDRITLYESDLATTLPEADRLRRWLDRAGAQARLERAPRLPGASAGTIARRALNWAEIRPEWGLAGCSAFVAAPRSVTSASNLKGRAFLHSYDWKADQDFRTLELILTAPVVVASWISLQYYGSSTAPEVFGSGNKLIHNVVGGFGVVEGNGGKLRAGLPWQAVHDGKDLVHTPLRLTVLLEAPQEAISGILDKHPEVKALFDNGWLHLIALKDGRMAARYHRGGGWSEAVATDLAA